MAGRSPPSTHHLDRRAGKLADEPGDNDDLLKTRELAAWLGVSEQWLEIGRVRNYGPPFIKIDPRMIRYPRGRVRRWLRTRA
jgi:predicted DNA-binding transcriptional regulator AlpA